MIRETAQPGGSTAKLAKRLPRFLQILRHGGEAPRDHHIDMRLQLLPQAGTCFGLFRPHEAELLQIMGSQFVQAYSLRHDSKICELFDHEFARCMRACHDRVSTIMDVEPDEGAVNRLRAIVNVPEEMAQVMTQHLHQRHAWFSERFVTFMEMVQRLHALLGPAIAPLNAQLALSGSFANLLHSRHLRLDVNAHQGLGLEPLWRILLKLQFSRDGNESMLSGTVKPLIEQFVQQNSQWFRLEIHRPSAVEGENKSDAFNLFFVQPGSQLTYEPLCLKIRLVRQGSNAMPPLTWIEGVPVTDLRYQIADYTRRAAKVEELVVKQALNKARRASLLMATQLEIASDE
ncbi:hypothetical protein ASC95_17820 [Pelomonas sp. Root1217]|uniref:hypothetical protein n=1 Tax=Pelomonas sp. Root1217 TaxID=1736430 RepID=UPI00070EE907|nr:hypothetical protein [Pelomonas sp. Root1217]KQV49454.1 hypothetical protein ASC95_17820 [Pelomonas sp. Root1217]